MLIDFFTHLRRHKLPCSLRELLDLHAALAARLVAVDMDEFYQLSRCLLVKDEAHYDRFDRAFAEYYEGLEAIPLLPESLLGEAMELFFELREVEGLRKKPSTSELLDWIRLLLADDIAPEAMRAREPGKLVPALYGALLKTEQDLHLFEKLAFLARRGS